MQCGSFRKPKAVPRRYSGRPLMSSVGPFEHADCSRKAKMSAVRFFIRFPWEDLELLHPNDAPVTRTSTKPSTANGRLIR